MTNAIKYAIVALRESAKQHRCRGDWAGHGVMCDRAAHMLQNDAAMAKHDENNKPDKGDRV